MARWVRIDRRYSQPYRLTGYALRAIFKWFGLLLAWAFVNSVIAEIHLAVLALATTGGLIWYAIHCARRALSPQPVAAMSDPPIAPAAAQWQFNAPPNWPTPPIGWSPEPGWMPDASWPPAPPGWQFWVPAPAPARGAVGERNSRVIPQDVKIAVAVRDQGKCVQCGSAEDLHYDHKVPWSRGVRGHEKVALAQLS